MEAGSAPGARADVPRVDAARARAVARALAGGAGLVGGPGGRGAGAGPAHGRRVARRVRPRRADGPGLRADGRLPPALDGAQQAELKAAVRAPPREAGIDLADWNWKVVREFVRRRFGLILGRSSCRNDLRRLGFVLRRPKKRLLKANAERRAAFVREYALLRAVARATGATVFFVDEAHFYADADLRGKWVLKGEPALVDSSSPRWGEKASYYSAVCPETGVVETMELDGNSCAETSVAFLRHLRARHDAPLI